MSDKLALFEDHIVRTFESDGEPWLPVVDLALAWGIDRTTPNKIIERNPEIFEGMVLYVGDVTSQERVVNERGLYLLMGKISADRLKNKEARAAIIRFQRWVPELIQRYRKKEIVPVLDSKDRIKLELQRATEYAEVCKCDARVFQAAVFKKHGEPELADALQVPSMEHGETGWYNVTQLVALCNDPLLNAERLNQYLKNKGYQWRDGYVWRLTPEGAAHGEEFWFTSTSKHSEWRIRWRESILYSSGLKRPANGVQSALAVR